MFVCTSVSDVNVECKTIITLPFCSIDHNSSLTIPRRWMGLRKTPNRRSSSKLTREASTSMEEIVFSTYLSNQPGAVVRPKSMCVPDINYGQETFNLSG